MLSAFQKFNLQLISLASGISFSETSRSLAISAEKDWPSVVRDRFALNSRSKTKKILSIETGGAHDIIRPSIYHVFRSLDYELDAILYGDGKTERWDFFLDTPYRQRNEIVCNEYDILQILTSNVVAEYDFVFFNTNFVYTTGRFDTAYDYKQLLQFLHVPVKSKFGCMTIAPHPCIYREWSSRTICFTHLAKKPSLIFSADYFSSTNQGPGHKRGNTFLVTGNINSQQKNHAIIIDAVRSLLARGTANFRILVNGAGNLEIPDDVSDHIEFISDNHPAQLFQVIDQTDFIIAGIDSQCKWQHETYGTGTCSCSLIYSLGFLRPYIVEDYFADPFLLDDGSALLYRHGELAEAMLRAIQMSDAEYGELTERLCKNRERRRDQTLSDVHSAMESLKLKKHNLLLHIKISVIYILKVFKYTQKSILRSWAHR